MDKHEHENKTRRIPLGTNHDGSPVYGHRDARHACAEIAAEADAKIAGLEAERDHWKANHDEMVQRNKALRDRPDLPADRLPMFEKLQSENAELRERVKHLESVTRQMSATSAKSEPTLDHDAIAEAMGSTHYASPATDESGVGLDAAWLARLGMGRSGRGRGMAGWRLADSGASAQNQTYKD